MSRKSILLAFGILVLLVGGSALGLFFLIRHEPSFYTRTAIPPGELRKKWSNEFRSEFANKIIDGILNERSWDPKFTETQFNSYFEEDFITSGTVNLIPEDVSAPRVAFEEDRVRIGFRYGKGLWSTIISLDLRVWLAANASNVLVMEVQGIYAGGLPIGGQSILEKLSEAARRQEMQVSWYRHDGNRVALIRFQAGKVHLRRVKLQEGTLHVTGGPVPSRRPPAKSGG